MKSIWGQNFTHFRWFYLIRSIFRYLIIKRTPVYVKNVMRTVLVVQPSFRTRAAARTESAATGRTAPAAATSTGTVAQNPGSGKSEFETKYRVSQNHGRQVWRVIDTKFHLPITQFVVIPWVKGSEQLTLVRCNDLITTRWGHYAPAACEILEVVLGSGCRERSGLGEKTIATAVAHHLRCACLFIDQHCKRIMLVLQHLGIKSGDYELQLRKIWRYCLQNLRSG